MGYLYRGSKVNPGQAQCPPSFSDWGGHAVDCEEQEQTTTAHDESLECGGTPPGGGKTITQALMSLIQYILTKCMVILYITLYTIPN